jgi:iron complex transport system ATP-binding protein
MISITGLIDLGTSFRLKDLNLSFKPGRLYSICGPNGSGKTSLLRAMAGVASLQNQQVDVRINNADIYTLSAEARAKILAWIPATHETPFDLPVNQIVSWGLWENYSGGRQGADDHRVTSQLKNFGIEILATKSFNQISLGEQKKVFLAKALASPAKILLLDEPLAALDPRSSIHFLETLRALCHHQGYTVLMSMHDLFLAARYTDWMLLLNHGEVSAFSDTENVVSSKKFEETFRMKSVVVECSELEQVSPLRVFVSSDESKKL